MHLMNLKYQTLLRKHNNLESYTKVQIIPCRSHSLSKTKCKCLLKAVILLHRQALFFAFAFFFFLWYNVNNLQKALYSLPQKNPSLQNTASVFYKWKQWTWG